MALATLVPESFYELRSDGRWNFFIDATLVKDFLICERRFYLKHIRNLRSKSLLLSKPFPMAIGGWWSDVMEVFYDAIREGRLINKADIQDIAMKQWIKGGLDVLAAQDPEHYEDFGGIAGAVLMLQEYYDSQYLIDSRIWKIVAAEAGFGLRREILVGQNDKVVVYWVGKPDLSIVEGHRLIPVDHKTVTRIDGRTVGKYKLGPQMPGYVFAHETLARQLGHDIIVDRCIVNICSRTRPSEKPRDGKKKPRFIRAYPAFSREEINEWRSQMILASTRLRGCIERQEWMWNTNSCDNIYMRECEFKKCDSSTPMARDIVLAADFKVTEPWRPYVPVKEED